MWEAPFCLLSQVFSHMGMSYLVTGRRRLVGPTPPQGAARAARRSPARRRGSDRVPGGGSLLQPPAVHSHIGDKTRTGRTGRVPGGGLHHSGSRTSTRASNPSPLVRLLMASVVTSPTRLIHLRFSCRATPSPSTNGLIGASPLAHPAPPQRPMRVAMRLVLRLASKPAHAVASGLPAADDGSKGANEKGPDRGPFVSAPQHRRQGALEEISPVCFGNSVGAVIDARRTDRKCGAARVSRWLG